MLNIGLIGAGRIGQVHAGTIQHRVPTARLAVVADVIEDAARACAERHGIPRHTARFDEVLSDPAVDAVLICTPTSTHADLIVGAAAAGKHIFTEKPIELDLGAVDRAVAAVQRAGVTFQVGFNRRFDPNFARVREAVARGEIGEPHLIHIISRDPAPPPITYVKTSGGIFLDMAIHDFDMARFLIGSEVEEVYVQAAVRVDPAIGEAGDVDTAVTLLRFANGVIGTIDNSRRAVYGYDQRVEVFGSGGAVHTANNYPNSATFSTSRGISRDLPLNFFMQRYTESYAVEIERFVDAVVNRGPAPVSAHDGRMAVVIGLAVRRSWHERRPVRVAEVG